MVWSSAPDNSLWSANNNDEAKNNIIAKLISVSWKTPQCFLILLYIKLKPVYCTKSKSRCYNNCILVAKTFNFASSAIVSVERISKLSEATQTRLKQGRTSIMFKWQSHKQSFANWKWIQLKNLEAMWHLKGWHIRYRMEASNFTKHVRRLPQRWRSKVCYQREGKLQHFVLARNLIMLLKLLC